nr:sugar ABC transporter permease [Tsukamurella paurometabola]
MTRRPEGRRRARRSDDTRLALLFILPAGIGLAVFIIWPLIRGIQLSFTKYNMLTPAEFNGVENYVRMFQDPVFWHSVRVTLYFVVLNIVVQMVFALVIAVLMHRLTQSSFVRGIVLSPYLMANVVAGMLFLWILDYQMGIGNHVLEWMGLDKLAFFNDPDLAMPTIVLVNVWRHVGYTALLIFAGLQMIPATVYEAAKLDGASETAMFFRITVPLLRPILALVLIVSVIGSFQVFDTVAVTTAGGPGNATQVLQYYIYDVAFGRFQFGYAFAMSVALLVLLSVITFVQYRLTRADSSDLD